MIYEPKLSPVINRAITRRGAIKQIEDYYERVYFPGYSHMTHQEKKESRKRFQEMLGSYGEMHTKEEAMTALGKKLSRLNPGMLKHLNQKLASGECRLIFDHMESVPEECASLAEKLALSISFGYFREYSEMDPDERSDVLQSLKKRYGISIEMPPYFTDENDGPKEVAEDCLISIFFNMGLEDLVRIREIFRTKKNCMYVRSRPPETEVPASKKPAEPKIAPKPPATRGVLHVDRTATRDGWSPPSVSPTRKKRKKELPLFGQGYLERWEQKRDEEDEKYTQEHKEE